MTLCNQLKEKYLNEMTELINEWKKNSARLREEGSNDEAILETIKVNVGDIFITLFNASYKRSCRNAEAEDIELEKLSKAYFDFFEKIPAPWKEKMAKDKEHNMMEEYYKEQIKLETVEIVKNLFIECYNSFARRNKLKWIV